MPKNVLSDDNGGIEQRKEPMSTMQNTDTVKPNPDPSVLTTESLQREVQTLEAADRRISQDYKDALELRSAQFSKDIESLNDKINTVGKQNRRIVKLEMKILHEKFKGQNAIFALMEDQRKERKEDDRRALDAALAAAEKARVADTEASDRANTKTELSTGEQLKQQGATAATAATGIVTLFNGLQTRVEKIENIKTGQNEQKQSMAAMWAIMGVMGFLTFGFITTVLAVVTFFIVKKP
jgi:hypothetical protein